MTLVTRVKLTMDNTVYLSELMKDQITMLIKCNQVG